METDELRWTVGRGGEAGDADAAGVRGKDGGGIGAVRQRLPGLPLDRFVLEDRLDHDVVPGCAIGPFGNADAGQELVRSLPVELALVHLSLEVAGDPLPALFGELRAAVGEGHLLAGRGADLGDAMPHQPRADDEDAIDTHRRRSVPARPLQPAAWITRRAAVRPR